MISEDHVHSPSHYTQGGIECWDAMKAIMSPEEFRGYLRGCAFKYLWRCRRKGGEAGGLEDVKKAREYLDKLIKEMENYETVDR